MFQEKKEHNIVKIQIEVYNFKTIGKEMRFRLFKDDRMNIDTCQENSRDFLSLGSKDTKWGCTFFFLLFTFQFAQLSFTIRKKNIISLTRIAIKFYDYICLNCYRLI